MNFILGTAGHIDHGKSTLVKALSGVDPDRLPEEQKRGVTIELGFAHLSLPAKKGTFEIGIVDVPGHADFINNMVAGVASLDLALFIVAADDTWMPQSEEHLQILSYLGISNFIIALTKADLAEDIEFSTEILREDLQGTALEEAPIIPVSAHTGEGMDELKNAIASTLENTPPPRDIGQPRLAIDRIFSPKGIGTVVTGTLTGGSLSVGDELTAFPSQQDGHIRTIQNHSSTIETALPGMRTALNIPDLPPAVRGKKGIHRGDLLVGNIEGKTSPSSDTVDVLLTRSSKPIPGQKTTTKPIKTDHRYLVHHGSGHTTARLLLPERPRLEPGETTIAQLRFETPVNILTTERLVLRDLSRQSTLAGAIVLDAHADRKTLRAESQQLFLQQRAENPNDLETLIHSLAQREQIIPNELTAHSLPFAPGEIKTALKKLTKTGQLTSLDHSHAAAPYWKKLTKEATSAIREFHVKKPDLPGIPTEALRKHLGPLLAPADALDTLLQWLTQNKHRVTENIICHLDHSLELPPELEAVAADIISLFDGAGLQAPNLKEVLNTPQQRDAYKFLTRTKKLIPLDPKITISATAYQNATTQVRALLEKQGQATASEIRQHLGTSRKILMPLVERLDREKITVRHEDYRTLV